MSSGRCWTGSSESRSLIYLSSSSVYGGSAGVGTFVVDGVVDMAT